MRCLFLALMAVILACSLQAGEGSKEQKTLLSERGKLVYSEAFNQPLAKGWIDGKGKWEIHDGVLRGAELASDSHGAVKRYPLKFHDAVIQFSFKLDGAKKISLSLNAAKGHVCRTIIQPSGFTVQKDTDKKTNDKSVVLETVTTPIQEGQWHTMVVELRGKEMLAQLDGKQVGFGSHDGIDVEKSSVGFTIAGETASFKDLKIWESTPNGTWAATKAKLLQSKK